MMKLPAFKALVYHNVQKQARFFYFYNFNNIKNLKGHFKKTELPGPYFLLLMDPVDPC